MDGALIQAMGKMVSPCVGELALLQTPAIQGHPLPKDPGRTDQSAVGPIDAAGGGVFGSACSRRRISLSRVLVSEVVDFAEIAPREHSCLSLTDTTECLTPEHPPSQPTSKVTKTATKQAR